MSQKTEYYVCEQDNIDHSFKTTDLTVDGVKYPNVQICQHCGSVFNFGGYKLSKNQLAGLDLNQFRMKEATRVSQAVMFAKKRAHASRQTAKGKRQLDRLMDTLLTEKEETKAIPPRSIWRMDSK